MWLVIRILILILWFQQWGYAALKPEEYVAFRAGEPNDETLEVFQLAGTDVPPLLSSLRLTALDMSKQLTSLDEKATFLEASKLLEKQKSDSRT